MWSMGKMWSKCVWCGHLCDDGNIVPFDTDDFDKGCFRICFDCEDNHTKEEYDDFVENYRAQS